MSTPGCFANVTFGDDRAVSNYALAKMKGSKIIHGTVKPRFSAPVFNIILLIEHIRFGPKKYFHSYLYVGSRKNLAIEHDFDHSPEIRYRRV